MLGWLFGKKKNADTEAVDANVKLIQSQLNQLGETLAAFEKKILADDVQMLQLLDLKFEKLYQRQAIENLQLTEIQNSLTKLSALVKEMDYAVTEEVNTITTTVNTSSAVGDMNYQLARRLIQEGQPVNVIIQQTNLSRDEISILRSLVTV